LIVSKEIMVVNQDSYTQPCPICKSDSFEPTGNTLDLIKILNRWKKEVRVEFSSSVWQEYLSPKARLVTLYRCKECGFSMFLPPIVGSQEFYSSIAEKTEYYVARKWEFLQAIRDLRRHRIRRVLDVGCGSGYFLDLLQEGNLSIEYFGYEFNSEIASQARAKGHRVYEGKFPEAILQSIEHEPFDAVCIFQVLEHLSDPMGFIKNIKRLLDPHGILIIGVPDAGGPVRYFSSALTDIPPHHVSRWCESVFRLGVVQQGFRIDRMAYEPLPFYLWSSYLPVIMEKDVRPPIIGRALNRSGITKLLIRILMVLRIKTLFCIPGHTLYVVLQRG